MSEARRKMRIHLVVEAAAGPIVSTPAPGTLPVGGRDGKPTRWACLCDPTIRIGGELDRGTDAPWGVRCEACEKKARELGLWRPRPGQRPDAEQMTADGGDCCG